MVGKPLVSICTLTYNHEKYISQTLDSLLNQKTDFDYEIIVHDDASTDSTQTILKSYQAEHPGKIRLILQSENQYSQKISPLKNFVVPKAEGKYISICEGDDYWTDDQKLSKDIQYLESNSECNLVGSYVSLLYQKTNTLVPEECIPRRLEIEDIIEKNYLHTCTMIVRAEMVKRNLHFYDYGALTNDRLWQFVSVMDGGYGWIRPEISGVYRIHSNGMFSPLKSTVRRMARLHLIDEVMPALKPDITINKRYRKLLEETYYLAIERNLFDRNFSKAYDLWKAMKSKKLVFRSKYFFDRLKLKLSGKAK